MLIRIKYLLLLFTLLIVSPGNIFSQSKTEKWGKAEVIYTLPSNSEKRDYAIKGESAGEIISKSFINTYWFFISDIDGDNCPFHPSCSSFFAESVSKTGLITGTLMFADRFTRDINIINRRGKYPLHKSGKYYDPPSLYYMNIGE
ncbi:MAG: membrane protein insertion efficiency factor YidD [Ignavibacteriaceae bacterium]